MTEPQHIPVHDDERAPAARAPLVLFVDDDDDVREAATMLLEDEGYDVRCAPHPVAALEALATATPDVVVTDLQMPYMNGLVFIDELRARGVEAPVVLWSALAVERCLAVQARVVAKGAGARALLAAVDAVRERRAR